MKEHQMLTALLNEAIHKDNQPRAGEIRNLLTITSIYESEPPTPETMDEYMECMLNIRKRIKLLIESPDSAGKHGVILNIK
ncbi:MAG: hypothetical protein V1759_00075 [bacterium]